MFMWRRHYPWLNITVLCSGDEHGCETWLTEWPGGRYPSETGKYRLFQQRRQRDDGFTSVGSCGWRYEGPCGAKSTSFYRSTAPTTPEKARALHNSGLMGASLSTVAEPEPSWD